MWQWLREWVHSRDPPQHHLPGVGFLAPRFSLSQLQSFLSDCSSSRIQIYSPSLAAPAPLSAICHRHHRWELPLGIHLALKFPSNHVCLGSWQQADTEPSTGLASGWIPRRRRWQDASVTRMNSTLWAIPLLGWTVPHFLVTSRSSWSWILCSRNCCCNCESYTGGCVFILYFCTTF